LVNVVLSSDSVTVLGGPSKLDVDLNIGASGERGSFFFTGLGNPNALTLNLDFPVVPKIFDIFIDVDSGSDGYLQAYQFINEDGQNNWSPAFRLDQKNYFINKVVDFENGEASFDINLHSLGLFNQLPFVERENSFTYFNVQATLSNINLEDRSLSPLPSSLSIEVGDVFEGTEGSFDSGVPPEFLPITLRAAEFDGTEWSLIENKKSVVYLSISFANPNEIFANILEGGD
jgi:hypothetical protein